MATQAGFLDVGQIEKTKENFRLLCNTKGRRKMHKDFKGDETTLEIKYKQLPMAVKLGQIILCADGSLHLKESTHHSAHRWVAAAIFGKALTRRPSFESKRVDTLAVLWRCLLGHMQNT